jgi:hypothetical protein
MYYIIDFKKCIYKKVKKYIFSKIKNKNLGHFGVAWPPHGVEGVVGTIPSPPGPPPWHLGRKGREMELGEILWWKRREQCIS